MSEIDCRSGNEIKLLLPQGREKVINLPSPHKISGTGIRNEDLFQNVACIKNLVSEGLKILKVRRTYRITTDIVSSWPQIPPLDFSLISHFCMCGFCTCTFVIRWLVVQYRPI